MTTLAGGAETLLPEYCGQRLASCRIQGVVGDLGIDVEERLGCLQVLPCSLQEVGGFGFIGGDLLEIATCEEGLDRLDALGSAHGAPPRSNTGTRGR